MAETGGGMTDQASIDRLAAAPVARGQLLIDGAWVPGEAGETAVLSPIDGGN